MQPSEIQIHTSGVSQPYQVIGEVEVKLSAATVFSPAPTVDDLNSELKVKAASMYANAVIDVEYSRSVSLTSYKVLRARGTAIILESADVTCPMCAETIKRAAKRCRFCGADTASH